MALKQTTIGTIFNEFISLKEFQDLDIYYKQPNLLKIIGKHRSETAHSSFWAWLLNPKECHKLGTIPLELFIKSTLPEFKESHNITDVSVVTESDIRGGRFDIFVDSNKSNLGTPFSIVIENKVNASENPNQTLKYYNWSQTKNSKKANYFIYIKPYEQDISGYILSADEQGEIFKKVSYQTLYDNVLLPLLGSNSEAYNKYANEYIISLSTAESDFGHLIVSKTEKLLYEDIIKDNKLLLEQIVVAYGKDKSIENHNKLNLFLNLLHYIRYCSHCDFVDRMNIISEILDGTRDFTRYYISDFTGRNLSDSALPKNQLLTFILNRLNVNGITFEEIQSILPPDLNLGTGTIIAYLSFDSEDEADKNNPFKGKIRQNPFYDFYNKIFIKDKIIVSKKAWTAKKRSELNGKSSIDVLIDYINSQKEIFQIKIQPVE